MELEGIRVKMAAGEYRFSDHAVKRMIKRFIDRMEIEEATLSGVVIEEYPDDKYSQSCLIYGKTKTGRNLHVQITQPPSVVIITAYEPDKTEWINYTLRRERQ